MNGGCFEFGVSQHVVVLHPFVYNFTDLYLSKFSFNSRLSRTTFNSASQEPDSLRFSTICVDQQVAFDGDLKGTSTFLAHTNYLIPGR